MKDEDIERIIMENLTPNERVSDDDCGKCVFYNLPGIGRRFACTNSDNVFSVYWTSNRRDGHAKPVLSDEIIDCIKCESAERLLAISKAIISKQYANKRGR